MSEKLLGSIEAGGTKFVCAVGNFEYEVVETVQFPTTTPMETLQKAIDFFRKFDVAAIGIGSFGPIDIHVHSATFGHVLSTPKKGWADFDFVGTLKKTIDVPTVFTTDVNSSAYGEYIKGAAREADSVLYFTIGTGIGGGAIQSGEFIGGINHAEMGHALVKRHPRDSGFKGVCPFHGDCLEGMAAGPSIEARTGIKGEKIPIEDDVWDTQAYYIAQAAYSATLTLAPEKIIFGGGVMSRPHMIELVRKNFVMINNHYVKTPPIEEYLNTTGIRDNGAATLGNFALALKEFIKN